MNVTLKLLDERFELLNESGDNINDVFGDIFYRKDGYFDSILIRQDFFKQSKIFKYILEKTNFIIDKQYLMPFRIKCIINNITEIPKCNFCKINNVKISRKGGIHFNKYCSHKCSNSCSETHLKMKKTYMKKYKTQWGSQSNIIKQKVKQTNLKRRGVTNPGKCNKVKEKIKNTCLKKYNKLSTLQVDFIREAQLKTFFENKIDQIFNTIKKNHSNIIPNFKKEEYSGSDKIYSFLCTLCNNTFDSRYDGGKVIKKCPSCFPKRYGKAQREVFDFIASFYNGDMRENDRSIISPLELDIVLVELKLAIEYNGLYWHSIERGCDSDYHYNKTVECEKRGWRLIHLFEDRWLESQDIIKERLRYLIRGEVPDISWKELRGRVLFKVGRETIVFKRRGRNLVVDGWNCWYREVLDILERNVEFCKLFVIGNIGWIDKDFFYSRGFRELGFSEVEIGGIPKSGVVYLEK